MLKCYVKSTREDVASKYLTEEVKTVEDAIQGASYIIAERISDDAKYRQALRETMKRFGHIVTKKKKMQLMKTKYLLITTSMMRQFQQLNRIVF